MSMDFDYQPVPDKKSTRSYIATLLLAWFLGPFGVHRFYTGYTGIGIAQLVCTLIGFTAGISLIWSLVDLISIALNKYTDVDGNELEDFNPGCGILVLVAMAFSVLMIIFIVLSMITPHYN